MPLLRHPRRPPAAADPEIERRRDRAGRRGLLIGVVVTVGVAALNLLETRDRLTPNAALLIVLVAALNVPLWIALALLFERLSRGAPRR